MIKNRTLLVGIHLFAGFFLTISIVPKLVAIGILVYALFDIYATKNKNNQSFLWAAYFVSAEVLMRMTGGAVFWEMGKYVTMLLLFLGLIIEEKHKGVPIVFLMYIFLLLVGVTFSNIPVGYSIRKAVVFNLSGPITLGVAAMYFYKRDVDYERFKEILFFSLLPVLSMLVLLYFRTPSLKEITFGSSANYSTSGGFGPNQVATALGYGIFILATLLLVKEKVSGYLAIDILLLFYLIYRGLLTFSRGGILTGFIAFVLLSVFYLYSRGKISSILKYMGMMLFFLVSVWIYSTNITGGMLENRYLGKNAKGVQKEDISSGRVDIFENQLETFMDNPIFGIGVGSGKYMRIEEEGGHVTAASHNEMSRLLEEHGLIGLFALLLLFFASTINFFEQPLYFKGFVIAFASIWFLTINHSAMRVAFPGFIYGLSLINVVKRDK
ncbi:hypothetical protein FHR24_001912 [Wenyingzhuangia heitensis]|uniref:O-antigen ligase-related domain-containing protein n=1 Tax=Wenyingzhuangia heitensis TaxID=1487859 RepID=A0ABX0UAQ1_9FLAO|nr:O-antigen ligase family protein [Wenyingzhuangia heitensis]NIJ45444.1 hypothetical protein [Wenyingzhuangia heitensis]